MLSASARIFEGLHISFKDTIDHSLSSLEVVDFPEPNNFVFYFILWSTAVVTAKTVQTFMLIINKIFIDVFTDTYVQEKNTKQKTIVKITTDYCEFDFTIKQPQISQINYLSADFTD